MIVHNADTVSTYPSKIEHLNLNCITTMKERYKIPIGYRHEVSVSPSIVAATLVHQQLKDILLLIGLCMVVTSLLLLRRLE